MAITSITGTKIETVFQASAGNTITGTAYSQNTASASIRKTYNFGTAAANAASGGGDQVFSFQQTIASSSSATVDLNAMTNLVQQTSQAIVRIKAWHIRLLDSADDSAVVTTTPSTAIYVNNIGCALPAPIDFGNGGSGLTLTLTVSAGAVTAVAIGAAGTGYPKSAAFVVTPVQSGGSGCLVGVVTNSSGVPTTLTFISGAGGSGYSAATVPSVVAGGYLIYKGGVHCYFDTQAGGFCTISSTTKNLQIVNTDTSNTAYVEISAFGATT